MARDAEIQHIKPHRTPNSSSDTRHSGGSGGGGLSRFPEGSLVEVRTDEVDFRGVYFSATVISVTPDSPKKGGRKKSEILYVEYHDLLAREDGSDRLREYVKLSHVRPAPPLQEVDKGFEPDDVVDAFYKDGWWQGVVSRVLQGGKRFVVTFQNPPDVLEFGIRDLRAHWDWVDGSWVRPQKQSISGLMFDVGRKVEVSFHRDDSQEAWFPATIREDLGNRVLLVEQKADEGRIIEARVDPLHVRPCPPLLKDKNFVLLEKVDAFFNWGWWSGVITKELENYRYIVYFKQMKTEKEFNQSELRPHMDWKDGKWFTSSQETSTRSDDGVHEHDRPGNSSASETTVSTPAVENVVDVKGTRDGKTSSSVKGSFVQDIQKMSHMTTTRRHHLSELGNTLSQPPKKFKRGNVVEEKQYKQDEPLQEPLCGFLSPESVDNVDTSTLKTAEDQSSLKSSWGEKSRKQRNVRPKQNVGGEIKSTSSSMKKSSTRSEILGLDALGEKLSAVGKNTDEDAQNERTREGAQLAIVIGLPCAAEKGTSEFRVSGGKRSNRSSGKEALTVVNGQEQQVDNSLIQEIKMKGRPDVIEKMIDSIREVLTQRQKKLDKLEEMLVAPTKGKVVDKDSTQGEIGISSERRKRGRPKKIPIESIQIPVSGNAQNGSVDLMEKDDDLQIIPQVEVVEVEASTPHQGKVLAGKEDVANDQSNLKNKRVRVMKRTLPIVLQEKGVEESVEQGDNRPSKRGRKKTVGEKITAQDEDHPVGESGAKMMDLNRIVDTARVFGEVSNNELDNEPLSKWIEGIHSPPITDGSRPPPEGNLEQSVSNAKKPRDNVVIDEVSEMQVENGAQESALVDKDSIVTSEPQSLPAEDNTVRTEKDSVAPNIADKDSVVSNELHVGTVVDNASEKRLTETSAATRREPQSLPFVVNTSLWKTIESTMEIFQRIPQNPHFEPLQHVKGSSSREGLAIGYMVAFASLAERTSRLQLTDPRSVVDDIMGTVAELERHGFDLSFVQHQVTTFLEAKDKEEQLVNEVNNLNSQIATHCHEKTKFDEEIREIEEILRKLQEKISVAESGKVKEDEAIASLQVRLKDMEEGIENLRRSFKVDSVVLR